MSTIQEKGKSSLVAEKRKPDKTYIPKALAKERANPFQVEKNIDSVGDTAEWLGEPAPEDIKRSTTKLPDVYGDENPTPPSLGSAAQIVHVQVQRGDPVIYRILALGVVLLLSSMFLQVLRADSLERSQKVAVQVTPSPGIVETEEQNSRAEIAPVEFRPPPREPEESFRRPVGPPQMPKIVEVKVEGKAGERVLVNVGLRNEGTVPSKPARLIVLLNPEGQSPIRISGSVQALPPNQPVTLEVQTPFEGKGVVSTDRPHFRTKEGIKVTYQAEIGKPQ